MADPQFLAEAERTLRAIESELSARLESARESNEAPGMSPAVGRLSFIDAHQQHQMDLHAQRRMSDQLVAVRAALKRVKDGTYGTCMKCGAAIDPDRLEYLPETPFCTPCMPRG